MDNIKLKIKKLNPNAKIPFYATAGASGMDLYAANEQPSELKPIEIRLIPTGLSIELPENYEAQIRTRSGLSITHGITLINCVGTIDEDYRGEVCVPLVNLSNEEYTINKGDRIAQMVIQHVTKVVIEETNELSKTQRASGGFGSTGLR